MNIARVRPFVSLVSVIFFIALLRTHSNWGSSSSSSSATFPSAESNGRDLGHENWQGTSRHVLGLYSPDDISEVTNKSSGDSGTRHWRKSISRPCTNVQEHVGFPDECSYVRANTECHSGTVIEYITAYYCTFSNAPILAYALFFVWLVMLFYMLGNTAADYFCCSLEKLSELLRLPPTVAGVSLLPLGNGAPDVFASIASFLSTGHSQVGLNSVLGGAVFVTSVVAGSVSLAVQPATPGTSRPRVDCICFLRDVGFFMCSLAVLSFIIYEGKISFLGAVGYLSLYVLYGITVATYELVKQRNSKKRRLHIDPPLPNEGNEEGLETGSAIPEDSPSTVGDLRTHWDWQATHHVAIYSHTSLAAALEATLAEVDHGDHRHGDFTLPLNADLPMEEPAFGTLCWQIMDLPLGLPRRLTIPVVENNRWSRLFAILSATLAPTLLAGVWDSNDGEPFGSSPGVYTFGVVLGIIFGLLAYFTLEKDHPPTRWIMPWVLGGFIMSIVWFYLIANELVAVLVALGVILQIDSAILGLTVLAWGNSVGDLISNLALACNGGDGVQIAISGCYAGPMFNTLVGLGLSFVLASWKRFPEPLALPEDNTVIYTIGFLFLSLLWALVALPARGMKPNKMLGVGLLFLYASFMSLRLADSLGIISLDGFHLGSSPGYLGVRIL